MHKYKQVKIPKLTLQESGSLNIKLDVFIR